MIRIIHVTPIVAILLLSSFSIHRAQGEVEFALSRWAEDGQRLDHWNDEGRKQFAYRAHGLFEENWYEWWAESIDALTIGPDGLLYAAGNDLGTISSSLRTSRSSIIGYLDSLRSIPREIAFWSSIRKLEMSYERSSMAALAIRTARANVFSATWLFFRHSLSLNPVVARFL